MSCFGQKVSHMTVSHLRLLTNPSSYVPGYSTVHQGQGLLKVLVWFRLRVAAFVQETRTHSTSWKSRAMVDLYQKAGSGTRVDMGGRALCCPLCPISHKRTFSGVSTGIPSPSPGMVWGTGLSGGLTPLLSRYTLCLQLQGCFFAVLVPQLLHPTAAPHPSPGAPAKLLRADQEKRERGLHQMSDVWLAANPPHPACIHEFGASLTTPV